MNKNIKVKRFIDIYNTIYDKLYKKEIKSNDKYIDNGDKLLKNKKFKPLLKKLIEYRQDIFTSDREVEALYRTYKIMQATYKYAFNKNLEVLKNE